MATCPATVNGAVRRYETKRAEFARRMLRLHRAASLLSTSVRRIGPRTYEIDPGDVIFLREALERCREVVENERNDE